MRWPQGRSTGRLLLTRRMLPKSVIAPVPDFFDLALMRIRRALCDPSLQAAAALARS